MKILRYGLTSLLCGAINQGSIILEEGPEKEIEHKAILRMKTNHISNWTGIPFKEIKVNKSIWFEGKEVFPTPRMTHLYSQKVSGMIANRSIDNIDIGIRYIPPVNFEYRLKKMCTISYNVDLGDSLSDKKYPIISTLHLPKLLTKLNWGTDADFFDNEEKVKPIYINHFRIKKCDSYSTVYYPEEFMDVYRASLDGDILIVEGMGPIKGDDILTVCESLGIGYPEESLLLNHKQVFGKINPINEKLRSELILKLTLDYNIYSLGRFATWRPGLLMDDVLADIFSIRKMQSEGIYSHNLIKKGI